MGRTKAAGNVNLLKRVLSFIALTAEYFGIVLTSNYELYHHVSSCCPIHLSESN